MLCVLFLLSEIVHAMNQFIIECIDIKKVGDDGNLVSESKTTEQRDIPWDDPYPFYVGMIPPAEDNADQADETSKTAASENLKKIDDPSLVKIGLYDELQPLPNINRNKKAKTMTQVNLGVNGV